MRLKTITIDGKTYAEVDGDKPVYDDDDGKTIAFDAPGTRDTIRRLNSEAKSHREAKEAAESSLKAFEGMDAKAAREAIEKLSQIDAKKLVEAGDMDAAIAAAIKPYTEKLNAAESKITDLTGSLNKEVIGNRFSSSKYAAEKLTPAGVDLIKTMFRDRLQIEGNQVIGTDQNGQKIYSRARPGELADFEEVIESFVESYPYKDHILKGSGHNGSGKQPGSDGHGGGSKVVPQDKFDAMTPKERASFMADGGQIAAA